MFFLASNDQMRTPNRIIQLHIPKRIKSAAHLIVNCNIKRNWIPITTIGWVRNSTALFFSLLNRIDVYIRMATWISYVQFSPIQWNWYCLNYFCFFLHRRCLEFHDVSPFILAINLLQGNLKLCRIRNTRIHHYFAIVHKHIDTKTRTSIPIHHQIYPIMLLNAYYMRNFDSSHRLKRLSIENEYGMNFDEC